REWYRECRDSSDLETTVDDCVKCGELLGITFKTHEEKLYGGKTRHEPSFWYSLGYCQGDFVAFDGTYEYAPPRLVREYAPEDEKLHAIADGLQEIQMGWGEGLTARISQHHYYGLEVAVYHRDDDVEVPTEVERSIKELLRDYCTWAYNQLRTEDEYQSSDEVVDENIKLNEYTFTVDG